VKISFSGHRDKLAKESDLESILKDYPDSVWVHGGAIGFDTQVETFARKHNIKTIVIRPNYEKFGKRAPLIRNDEILELGEILVALYDGRKSGGTFYTITKAKKLGKKVLLIKPLSNFGF
jgi:hypothetical protein